jgi:hypothetical protein
MEIPGREITTLRTAVHYLNSVAPYPITSPFGSLETSDLYLFGPLENHVVYADYGSFVFSWM